MAVCYSMHRKCFFPLHRKKLDGPGHYRAVCVLVSLSADGVGEQHESGLGFNDTPPLGWFYFSGLPSQSCLQAHGPLLGHLVLEFLRGYTGPSWLLTALLGGLAYGQGLAYGTDTVGSEICIFSLTSQLQTGYFQQHTWMSQRHFILNVSNTKLKISHSSGYFSLHIFHPHGLFQPLSVIQVRHTRAVFTPPLCLISNQWPHLSLLPPNTLVASTSPHFQPHHLLQATIISILVSEVASSLISPVHPLPLPVCPSCYGWSGV